MVRVQNNVGIFKLIDPKTQKSELKMGTNNETTFQYQSNFSSRHEQKHLHCGCGNVG